MTSLSPFPPITPTIDYNFYCEKVSQTSISFQGNTIPICIKAYIYLKGVFYTPDHPSMFFEVEREDKPGHNIGWFSIMRAWDKIDRYGNLQIAPHFENDPIKMGDQLRNRRIYVCGMVDNLGTDPANGFSPVVNVLTQLAIEILNREMEGTLVIDTTEAPRYFDATLLFSGGFAVRKIKTLGLEVKKEGVLWRNFRGQFFTPHKNWEDTRAHVAFCANKTWKQIIQEQPLLNFAPGRVMQVFQDLSAYEWTL